MIPRRLKQTKDEIKHRRLYTTYGVTLEEWNLQFYQQNQTCFICQEPMTKTGKVKILCQDHIHQKGYKKMSPEEKKKYSRGLLCFLCNTMIKFEKTGIGRKQLEGMIRYFDKYPFKGEI